MNDRRVSIAMPYLQLELFRENQVQSFDNEHSSLYTFTIALDMGLCNTGDNFRSKFQMNI